MNKLILTNEIRQSEPKKNLVLGNPVKEGLKLGQKNRDSILESLFNRKVILKQLIENTSYPDFRYFCPSCGTLDVCIIINEKSKKITVDCLECKKVWIEEDILHNCEMRSCLC